MAKKTMAKKTKTKSKTVTIPRDEYEVYRECVDLIELQCNSEGDRRQSERQRDDMFSHVMGLLRGDGGHPNLFGLEEV